MKIGAGIITNGTKHSHQDSVDQSGKSADGDGHNNAFGAEPDASGSHKLHIAKS